MCNSITINSLGPLDVQDEAIEGVPVQLLHGSRRVLAVVVSDESEPFRLAGVLVLGQENSSDRAERLEQVLQIALLRFFGQVCHAQSCLVVI